MDMKFFRGLFGSSRKADTPKKTGTSGGQYNDVIAKPGSHASKGTAEIAAEEARKASERSQLSQARANKAERDAKAGKASATQDGEKSTMSMIRDINAKLETAPPAVDGEAASQAGPSIWDLDGDDAETDAAPAPVAAPAPAAPVARASARQRRTKTRLIGFDKSDGSSVDALATAPPAAETVEPAPKVTFPVGWILVVKGPGRGETFPLLNGLSSIGRGLDQTVRLDFGDAAVSRSGHAALAYDNDKKTFMLGHGNKANIVRLNDTPVISNEPVKDGDHIRIGETTLRLVTLCNDNFDWSNYDDAEGDEDVAIA